MRSISLLSADKSTQIVISVFVEALWPFVVKAKYNLYGINPVLNLLHRNTCPISCYDRGSEIL